MSQRHWKLQLASVESCFSSGICVSSLCESSFLEVPGRMLLLETVCDVGKMDETFTSPDSDCLWMSCGKWEMLVFASLESGLWWKSRGNTLRMESACFASLD